MAVYSSDGQLVSDESEMVYDVDRPFWKVLQTLPDDEPIPYALVMLGLLTEQLNPVGVDRRDHVKKASESVDKAPSTHVPPQTRKGIQWLLGQVRDSLSSERKQLIGELLSEVDLATRTTRPSEETEDSGSEESSPSEPKENKKSTTSTGTIEETQTAEPADESEDPDSRGGTASKSLECEFCGATFNTTDNILSHSIQCDERPADARYTCEHCGNEYISENALAQHLENCGEDDTAASSATHTCSGCGTEFDSIQELISHRPSCSVESPTQGTTTSGRLVTEDAVGRVKKYMPGKGYGFIRTYNLNSQSDADAGPEDVFFHVSDYPDSAPREGDRLRFEVERTDEGLRATEIELVPLEDPDPWDDTFATRRPRWGRNA